MLTLFKKSLFSITLLSAALIVTQQSPTIIEDLKDIEQYATIEKNTSLFLSDEYKWYKANAVETIFKQLRACMEKENQDTTQGLIYCYNCHMLNMHDTVRKNCEQDIRKRHYLETLIHGYNNQQKNTTDYFTHKGAEDGIEYAEQIVAHILLEHTK